MAKKKTMKAKVAKTAESTNTSPSTSWKDVFFGNQISWSGIDIGQFIKDSWLGFVLSILLGYGVFKFSAWAGKTIKGTFLGAIPYSALFDTLVIAIIAGMLVGIIIRKSDKLSFKVLPGLLIAQIILLPVGIVLYGKNLNFKQIASTASTHGGVLVQLLVVVATTFFAVYYISKAFGLNERLRYVLGFGSSVCGAAAIGVTSPICEAEPDDTSTALVMNTILTVLIVGFLVFVGYGIVGNNASYARMAGDLVPQTGFTKVALTKVGAAGTPDFDLGVVLKAIRVSLLVISIPVVSYLLKKRIFLPWYVLAMIGFGVWFSYGSVSKELGTAIGNYATIALASALIAIGMNADVLRVIKKIWTPLFAALLAFGVGVCVFLLTNLVMA